MSSPTRPPGRCAGLAALAFGLALGSNATSAQPPAALEFGAALALATERAPLLRAADATARAARERAVAAARRPDPVLRIGIQNLPVDGPDRFSVTRDFMTMRSIGAMQELTREHKLRARAASFEAEAAAALAMRAERRAAIERETALAWLERRDLERLRGLLLQQRDEARLAVDAADSRYRSGRGAQADVYGARAEVSALDDRLAALDARIEQAALALERWVGADAARAPLGARPDVARATFDTASLEARLDELPPIVAIEREIARADAEVEHARAEGETDWTAELMFSQRGPQYSNMVSLNLSRPLATRRAERQDREVAARQAAAQRLRDERDDALREWRARIGAWRSDWASALERGRRHEQQLIPLAAERTRAELAAYSGGGGSLDAVLAARRAELAARIERLQLDIEAARVWARLNHLYPNPEGPR